ncbi:NAD(P)H-hydrate dehydratase [Candidatus Peregrinibacteria bacterium]|nr:NAD(P)H-hydrate dehydratase [Candidatus Peregrinibacteria bacterium]MBI3816027.1 NAD(P)H-hydrate dehydratase [Candidatus Peregrinibacteria bacterium]
MHRDPHSHKGENGAVAVIGGSLTMHGAPLFSALAAEASGVDLVYICVPRIHQEVARTQSLNFQVHPFRGDDLRSEDLEPILELLATIDCAVIGPGLDRSHEGLEALRELIDSCHCAMVLDASALQPWTLDAGKGKTVVATPHLGELERMGIEPETIGDASKQHGVTIHVKGHIDRIAGADGTIREIRGGNAGLTVGGTGDALAGLIGGLLAQHLDPVDACVTASTVIKRAGTLLLHEYGYAYTTREVIRQIPHLVNIDE